MPAGRRRAEIAAAARRVALSEGLAAVTMRAVAAEAGVAPALVAHYVPSMDALVADTFAAIVSEELVELRALAVAAPEASAALSTLLDTLLDTARDDVTLVWVQGWGLGGRNDTLGAAVRQAMDDWEDFLAGVVRSGAEAGCFHIDDPHAVARQLLGMIDGVNAHALVRWRDAPARRLLLGVAAEAMLRADRGSLHLSSGGPGY